MFRLMQISLRELSAILGITVVIALLGQLLLPDRIPFRTTYETIITDSSTVILPLVVIDSTPENEIQELQSISTSDAYEAFLSHRALFIDARSVEDFQAGHIKDAWSLPEHAFMDSLDILDTMAKDQLIITYCDGQDCNASIELAAQLGLMGFTRVHYYFGGWNAWIRAGYPQESG